MAGRHRTPFGLSLPFGRGAKPYVPRANTAGRVAAIPSGLPGGINTLPSRNPRYRGVVCLTLNRPLDLPGQTNVSGSSGRDNRPVAL